MLAAMRRKHISMSQFLRVFFLLFFFFLEMIATEFVQ